MGVLRRLSDGLVNVVANLGTSRDKAAHTQYVNTALDANTLLAMYRNSWLARKIVDIPAMDATRKWRYWRAEADQISRIEALERTLAVQRNVGNAMIAARLYGGAAIYLNTDDEDQTAPLRPGTEIKSLLVLTRASLSAQEVVRDIYSAYFGKPEYYTLNSDQPVRIHASRLVIFQGAQVPTDPAQDMTGLQGWGDSVLQSTLDAIQQVDATMANIASLVFEAKIDVLKFDGFADLLSDDGGDAIAIRRMTAQMAMKGVNGAVVIDSKDDYQQKTASFSGLPEVVTKFQDAAAGASGIPVTRLFGRAAAGLSGSGDGDERVYFDVINYIQSDQMGPAMALLDDCIITQALGGRPSEIFYEWAPLRQISEAERAEIFSKTASAARALAGANAGAVIPLDALSDALVNELTEQGVLPGLEPAIKEYGSLREQDGFVGENEPPSRLADAAPMPLYVHRKVKNGAEILAHYVGQGVNAGLIEADDMHVTITYSKAAVNWMTMGESWQKEIEIQEGGPRINEGFGPDRKTLVLTFASSELQYRHSEMVERGASWDWPDYQPHITIAYEFDGDISAIKPWVGEIELGPEIFEPLDDNWQSKGVE